MKFTALSKLPVAWVSNWRFFSSASERMRATSPSAFALVTICLASSSACARALLTIS
jgi:hypothetical protein